ncbi:MAG: hypothetical protein AB1643_00550 [Patescibacteria group bacterium]
MKNQGFIKLLITILIIITIFSLLDISIRSLAEKIWNNIKYWWGRYLKESATRLFREVLIKGLLKPSIEYIESHWLKNDLAK